MPRSARRRRVAAFTLLETVLALALTAVVLRAAWGAAARAGLVRQRTLATVRDLRADRDLLLEVAAAASAAVPDGVRIDPATDGSTLRLVVAEPAPRVLVYTPDADRLLRAEASPFRAADEPVPAGVVVARGLRHFAVRAFDGRDWHDTWAADAPLHGLEITLVPDDGELLSTRVALPVVRKR